MQTVREARLIARPELLAAIGDSGWIHRIAEPAHAVQVSLAVHLTEEPALFESDAVLARNRSAQADTQADDLGRELLGTIVRARLASVVQDQWVQVPVARVEDIGDADTVACGHRFDLRQGLTQARARHHAILHDEIRTEAAHR